MTRNQILDILQAAAEVLVVVGMAAIVLYVLWLWCLSWSVGLRSLITLDNNLPPAFESKDARRARLQAELDELDAEEEREREHQQAKREAKKDRARQLEEAKFAREEQERRQAATRARREAEARVIENI